ncbi:MAG: epimerase [Flavobacteriaceae bacterium]|nr:epimerase [Flavobacteriaceae bacterium]|tara:strand:- start:5386 stop:6213 length:828 start_codon:yes stop_codon:yes gene_type:complete
MNKQNIVITGATGFIAKNLIPRLLNKKYKILILVRSTDKIKKFKWFSKITFIKFDFNNQNLNLAKIKNNSTLLHLAWEGLPNYNSKSHLKNVSKQIKFLKKLIEKKKIKNLIVTGTCQEYGLLEGMQNTSQDVFPTTYYAKAKVRLYKKIINLKKKNIFYFKWLRLYYTWGKYQQEDTLFSQLNSAIKNNEKYFKMSKGDQLRDYIPISTMIRKIIKTVNIPEDGVYNICSEKPISIKALVKKIITMKKSKIRLKLGYYPYPSYEPKNFWGKSNI